MLPPAGGILADFNKYRYKSLFVPIYPIRRPKGNQDQ